MEKQVDKYLVVDVTTLIKWNRSPVGIIRTQLEFVYFLLQNDKTAMYFQFNDTKDDLLLVLPNDLRLIVSNLLNFKNKTTISKPTIIVKSNYFNSRKDLIKKTLEVYNREGLKSVLIKVCERKCPVKYKDFLKRVYKKLFSYTNKNYINEHTIDNSIGTLLFAPEINHAKLLDIPFLKKNSILVSIGLDWDNSNYPLLYWLKKKIGFEFVGAFYDGIPVVYPELVQSFYFSQKFFSHLYYLIHLSDKIFCISDYSRDQLSKICDEHHIVDRPNLKTIHLGDSIFKEEVIEKKSQRFHKKDYVLYVSTIEARKNHKLLLSVWSELLKDKSIDLPDLVFVGMMGWGVEDLYEMYSKDKELQKVIYFYDDVDDIELVTIYKNAKFTLFPSYVEGWGLGAVESLLYDKPCIISDCPALIEATQGLMPSVNPDDRDGWINIVKLFISDESKLDELKLIIDKKFQSRSWSKFSEDFEKFSKGVK